MIKLTNQAQKDVKVYDILTAYAEEKMLAIPDKLNIDNFAFERKTHSEIEFYDTYDNLLTKTGILLYKTLENGKLFFKIEKLNFLPNVTKFRETEIFEREITSHDSPSSQAFYLVEGITSLFSTQFAIDLENIVRCVIPKLKVEINGMEFKGFNGSGFKCKIEFQKVRYTNFTTKRKKDNTECTITNVSLKTFDKEFNNFLGLVEKYCKDILPKKDTRFDYGMRITRILPKLPKEKKQTKKPDRF